MQTISQQPSTRALLKAAWRLSPPSRFLDYKDFLRTLHSNVEHQIHGKYAYTQFSNDLGFERSNVAYMVVHKWRRLSQDQAEGIIQNIGMTGPERRFFLKLIHYTDARSQVERRDIFRELVSLKQDLLGDGVDKQLLKFFSKWQHAAIFEMIGLPDFSSDPDVIASKFYRRLSPEEVKESLSLLEAMGLIRYDEEMKRYIKTDKTLSSGEEVRGLAVVGYHFQMMDMAAASMTQVPHEEREISSVTLSVNPAILKRLKDDVQLFKKYTSFLADQCEDPQQVVQLNLQLFSITKPS